MLNEFLLHSPPTLTHIALHKKQAGIRAGQASVAWDCYHSAAYVNRSSEKGSGRPAARVGEAVLRIGKGEEYNEEEVQEMKMPFIKESKAHGALFEAVARVLEAILAMRVIEIKCITPFPLPRHTPFLTKRFSLENRSILLWYKFLAR